MSSPSFIHRSPIYYGWWLIPVAACCMLGTLPGRTFGLSLLTESLLSEFELSRTRFAWFNGLTALLGASFCLFVGKAVDRFGIRLILGLILITLGASTWLFSIATSIPLLVLSLFLARALGQSGLSLASLALIGKWFVGRLGSAMGLFSVLVSFLFALSIPLLQMTTESIGWRQSWALLGGLIALGALPCWLLVRNRPEACGLQPDPEKRSTDGEESTVSFTLAEAIQTPLFWVFTLGSALFNLVIAGVFLFNESILVDLGYGSNIYRSAMGIIMLTGMIGSLLCGWLVRRVRMGQMMAVALVVIALSLIIFPRLGASWQVLLHAVPLGFAGGVIPVVFFTCYGRAFGREHLGAIQGAAQVTAVFASASGPLIFAWFRDHHGSYWPPMIGFGIVLLVLGLLSWPVRRPLAPKRGADLAAEAIVS